MANIKKTLESGAKIEIQMASFERSHRLMQVVKASMISMDDVIALIVFEGVQPALWECMECCLYNGIKIDKDTFEAEEARGDYLLVAKEVLVHNLGPFFKNLASKLSGPLQGEAGSSQG